MRLRFAVALLALLCGTWYIASVAWADGRWQATTAGCLVWDALPQSHETVTWSGACVDGKASGQGVELYRYRDDGAWQEERYVGEMQAGKLHGAGILTYDNGDRFEGVFTGGRRAGQGTYTHVNGDRYEGDFIDDKMTGRGTFSYHAGGRYEGEFVNGEFQGHGTFVFANGSRYEGGFRGGLPNGSGTFRAADGETVSGNWLNGCFRQGDRVAAVGTSKAQCGYR
ncbi:MAG: hypothetical protein R3F42_15835 [Pseudomonadota bacterium]